MMGGDDRRECSIISPTGDERAMSSSDTDPVGSLSEGLLEPCSGGGEITGVGLLSSKM